MMARLIHSRPAWVLILALVVVPLQLYFARRQWSERPLQEGVAAPAAAVTDARGDAWSIADERGRFVILSFWASWCGPCRRELPELDSLRRQLDSTSAIRFYAVNVGETETVVRRYFDSAGLSLPLLFVSAATASDEWSVQALPTLVVIDRQGDVMSVQTGYQGWGVAGLALLLDGEVSGAFGKEVSPVQRIFGTGGRSGSDSSGIRSREDPP